ncbi:MAG TPA: hypothetical protein VJU61_27370, partial [Polyangiaceae bacterium]|nr:hypothetical protein [Polyangiaceae bacterium]
MRLRLIASLCCALVGVASLPSATGLAQAPAPDASAAVAAQPAPESAAPAATPGAQQGAPEPVAGGQPEAAAADKEHDVTELSKQTQNPVADLVSFPFQFNFNNGGALRDETQLVLNFQPVIPIHLGSKVNLIARTVMPIITTPNAEGGRDRGLGDTQLQLYFAPAKGKIMWGVGPMLSFPIATVPAFVTGSWGLGAGGLVVATLGPFVIGALVNQIWNIKDNDGRPRVNAFLLQPFFNFNFGPGWAVGLGPIITANWDANRGN